MGDTNTRYTRAADTITGFAADNGLTDAWVQLVRGGTAPAPGSPALVCDPQVVTDDCEVVDKVLYRGSGLISLNATSYGNEHAKFLDEQGRMLSDHDPVMTRFGWTRNPALRLSDQFGGPHGDYFTDVEGVPAAARVRTLTLRSGSRVDQVGVMLDNGRTLVHGGGGGTATSLVLGSAEYVTSATLCQGSYGGHTRIFSARFTTSVGRVLAGGSATADCVTRTAPDGWQLAGFHGRAGDEVDKLGFVYTQR
jgi:hypothetical protein